MRKNLIGDRMRLARAMMKPPLNQTDLLAKLQLQGLDFSQSTLSKIENGDRSVSDIELVAIADALKVKILWLLGQDEAQV